MSNRKTIQERVTAAILARSSFKRRAYEVRNLPDAQATLFRLYGTTIADVQYDEHGQIASAALSLGGYSTHTTVKAMNAVIRALVPHTAVVTRKGRLYLQRSSGGKIEAEASLNPTIDYMLFTAGGNITVHRY